MKEAIDKAGYTEKIVIGMDVAASEFHRDGKYDLDFKSPADPSRYITGDQLGALYQDFVRDYPGKNKGCGRKGSVRVKGQPGMCGTTLDCMWCW